MAALTTSNYRRYAMNWMDDDSEGGGMPTIKWYQVLLFPFFMLPLAFIFAISEVLESLAVFAYAFYDMAKNVSESGKLEYPRLVLIGVGVAIILPYLISKNLFKVSDHPVITFCASIFVILCSIAPLTGLVWWLFNKSKYFSKSDDIHGG
jgi:hypothetical protein